VVDLLGLTAKAKHEQAESTVVALTAIALRSKALIEIEGGAQAAPCPHHAGDGKNGCGGADLDFIPGGENYNAGDFLAVETGAVATV